MDCTRVRPSWSTTRSIYHVIRVTDAVKRRAETSKARKASKSCSHGGRVRIWCYLPPFEPYFFLRFLSLTLFLEIFLAVKTRGSPRGKRVARRRRNLTSSLLFLFLVGLDCINSCKCGFFPSICCLIWTIRSIDWFSVDPFAKKDWYDIKAPSVFSVRNVGKTLVSRTQGTKVCYSETTISDFFW